MSGIATADRRENIPENRLSRPSKNNGSPTVEAPERQNLSFDPDRLSDRAPVDRPVSVDPGVKLRDEARKFRERPEDWWTPVEWAEQGVPPGSEVQARNAGNVLEEFRTWMEGYHNAHLEFENQDGDLVRAKLENSYMESYSTEYYAKLKQFERAVERHYRDATTVMLTLTASHENANGDPRAPGDHMRDIAEGWRTARQHLYSLLSDAEMDYVKIWEPHQDGYGHLHVGVVTTADVSAAEFAPFMASYTENVKSAGTDAHRNRACGKHADGGNPWEEAKPTCEDCHTPVSVNDDVENMGSYLSEYLGIYGEEESVLDRSLEEQLFYAVSWATRTRRLDFSNGAQELIAEQNRLERREEVEATAADRGGREGDAEASQTTAEVGAGEPEVWTLSNLTRADQRGPDRHPPPDGGAATGGPIDGLDHADPRKEVD